MNGEKRILLDQNETKRGINIKLEKIINRTEVNGLIKERAEKEDGRTIIYYSKNTPRRNNNA